MDPEAKLKELGITLPTPGAPIANYVNAVQTGNLLFLAGKGPLPQDGKDVVGRLGKDMTIEQGYQAARSTAIAHLAVLKKELGDLKRVVRIVKVLGMVNSDPAFTQQPAVVNGYSDLMVAVFGDKGKHARSAVGMATLPAGIPVEVEVIVEIGTGSVVEFRPSGSRRRGLTCLFPAAVFCGSSARPTHSPFSGAFLSARGLEAHLAEAQTQTPGQRAPSRSAARRRRDPHQQQRESARPRQGRARRDPRQVPRGGTLSVQQHAGRRATWSRPSPRSTRSSRRTSCSAPARRRS